MKTKERQPIDICFDKIVNLWEEAKAQNIPAHTFIEALGHFIIHAGLTQPNPVEAINGFIGMMGYLKQKYKVGKKEE